MKKKRFSVEHITAVLQAGHQRCAALRQRMREMAQTRVRFGYRRLRVLMVREGWEVSKERFYRVYIEELLALRRKRPWRHASGVPREQRRPATDRNDIWSMDFVSDELADGRRFRALTVIDLDFSRRGKPTDTATIESFNGRFREECLNVHWFASIDDAQQKIDAFRWDYNEHHPHRALKGLSPREFAEGMLERPPAHSPSEPKKGGPSPGRVRSGPVRL